MGCYKGVKVHNGKVLDMRMTFDFTVNMDNCVNDIFSGAADSETLKLVERLQLHASPGQASVVDTKNTMRSRTEGCIAIGGKGSLTDNVNLYRLDTRTLIAVDRRCRRDHQSWVQGRLPPLFRIRGGIFRPTTTRPSAHRRSSRRSLAGVCPSASCTTNDKPRGRGCWVN